MQGQYPIEDKAFPVSQPRVRGCDFDAIIGIRDPEGHAPPPDRPVAAIRLASTSGRVVKYDGCVERVFSGRGHSPIMSRTQS